MPPRNAGCARIVAPLVACLGLLLIGTTPVHARQAQASLQTQGQAAPAPTPKRKPYPPLFEFPDGLSVGVLSPGVPKSFQIRLTNPENDVLKVTRIRGSCPCITVDATDLVVEPGETVTWTLNIDTPETVGPFNRRLFIDCEGYGSPFSRVIQGEISLPIRVLADGVGAIGMRSGMLEVSSVDSTPFRVLKVNEEAPVFDGFDPANDVPTTSYTIPYEIPGLSAADLPRWFVIETDHPDTPIAAIKVSLGRQWQHWRPPNKWRWWQDHVDVGDVELGSPATIIATVAGMPFRADRALDLSSPTPGMRIELIEARKPAKGGGTELVMRLMVDRSEPGMFMGVVEVAHEGRRSGLDFFGRLTPRSAG